MPRVRVEQASGEIGIFDGVSHKTWTVKNHIAEVKEADLALFLRGSEGKVIEPKPDSGKDEK